MHNENLCTIWKTMELPGKEWATVQPAHLDKQQLQFQLWNIFILRDLIQRLLEKMFMQYERHRLQLESLEKVEAEQQEFIQQLMLQK